MFSIHPQNNIQITDRLFIKPDYKIHPEVSGNKFRKLKYNIFAAKDLGCKGILTFGGAYSNHIAAVSAAAKFCNLKSVGIIRGAELSTQIEQNPTLNYARKCGMSLNFISRKDYKLKASVAFLDYLKQQYPNFLIIPEGGTNAAAIKGCEEILTEKDFDFDYIATPVGTGGTMAGLINASDSSQRVLGFSALKGYCLSEDISKFVNKSNWDLITNYHFGGYAKINVDLIRFMNTFKTKYAVPLDPVYTAKMLYGVMDLLAKDYFPKDAKILVIHTGGLQGIAGMNIKLKQANKPLII